MPNVYANLPMPVLNGAGAAVDVSAMGGKKTLVVSGPFAKATVTVEGSPDAAGTTWGPLATFSTGDPIEEIVAVCSRMRVNVRGRLSGDSFAAIVDVGGDPAGMTTLALALPAFNGAGAAADSSSLGSLRTFICAGTFPGVGVLVEGSNDGGVTWAPVWQFTGRGGVHTMVDLCGRYRLKLTGRVVGVAFACALSVAAAVDPAPAGTGSVLNVQSFTYVATGAEGTAFNVPIPVAQPNANYVPLYSLYDVANHVTISFPVVGRTTLLLPVELSAALTAGDTIRFTVYNTP